MCVLCSLQAAEFNFASPPNKMTPLSKSRTKEFFSIHVDDAAVVAFPALDTVVEGEDGAEMSVVSDDIMEGMSMTRDRICVCT